MGNLEDIKVGDKVVLNTRYTRKVCKVERLTKTLVIVNNLKFRKVDGRSTKWDSYYSPYISKASEEIITKIEEENKRDLLIKKIKDYPLEKLSTEELGNIYEIINNKDYGKRT